MGGNRATIIVNLFALATFVNLHGFIDTSKLSINVSMGTGNIGPTLFGTKHTVPWNNNSTYVFTYFEGNSNHSVFAMIPGKASSNFQIGIENNLRPSLRFSTGIGYQNCHLEVLRFDYDSTSGGYRYGITSKEESSFFPSRYKINYKFINLPIVLVGMIPLGSRGLMINCGIGFNLKAVVGRPINTTTYFRSTGSNKLQTGVNINYSNSLGISPTARLGIEYPYNNKTKFLANVSFENVATRQYQRIDIVDSKNDRIYYSSIFPAFSNWTLNIGIIRSIK